MGKAWRQGIAGNINGLRRVSKSNKIGSHLGQIAKALKMVIKSITKDSL